MLNKISCFKSKISQEKVLVLRKLFLENFKMQAESCFKTKISQEKSCKCLTKILALNTSYVVRKVLLRNQKVYWKVLLLIQTDSRRVLLWNKRFLSTTTIAKFLKEKFCFKTKRFIEKCLNIFFCFEKCVRNMRKCRRHHNHVWIHVRTYVHVAQNVFRKWKRKETTTYK